MGSFCRYVFKDIFTVIFKKLLVLYVSRCEEVRVQDYTGGALMETSVSPMMKGFWYWDEVEFWR